MALESVTTCPICKGNNFDPFNTFIDFTTSKEEFAIVACKTCNFLITSPRPDSNSIGKYYQSENYISHTNSSKNLIDKLYKAVRSFTLRWKLNLIRSYKPNGKILDYGCGTGEFLNTCKTADWICTGIEPSVSAKEKAAQLTNLNIAGSLDQIAHSKFDVITLWHVLEHVENLNEKLSELKSYLAEGGIIFIAVPNHESLDSKIYKSYWAGYDIPRHLWHFTQSTMSRLLTSHGLKLINTIPMKQDSFYVSLLSEKYRQPKSNILVHAIKAFVIGLRSNLAAKKKLNYSSLVYIAKA
jgi:2-polyprenyl-3-methyl-5-hydroxy-6-metoxy-1,4-benzoquinol methylase